MYNLRINEKLNYFVVIENILLGIIILATLLDKSKIVTVAFFFSFVIIFIYLTIKLKHIVINIISKITFYIFFVSLFSVLLNFIISNVEINNIGYLIYSNALNNIVNRNKGLNFNYFNEYLFFLSTIFLLYIYSFIDCSKKTGYWIIKFNIIIAAFYPLAFLFFPQNDLLKNITLNFRNSNLTGMFIFHSILYCVLGFIILRKRKWKIISFVIFIFDMFLLYKTGERNALLSLFFFTSLFIILIIKKKNTINKYFILLVVVLPIVFVPVYLLFIKTLLNLKIFNFFISPGKSLTSRVQIWIDEFSLLNNNWILGNYSLLRGNMHNSYLVILMSYGVITLILVIIYLYNIINNVNIKRNSKKNILCIYAFCTIIIMGFGEGILFSGGLSLNILSCGFLLLSKCNYD